VIGYIDGMVVGNVVKCRKGDDNDNEERVISNGREITARIQNEMTH
jgi:hypothetical protein